VKETIRSSDEISALFKTARRQATANMLVLIAPHQKGRDQKGRVAFIAGKRIGNAPLRSRAKRVMREAARQVGLPCKGFDLALVARDATAAQNSSELARELALTMRRWEADL
jgi:ribonuclease P protein component